MEKQSTFQIPIVALKNKVHHFEYLIDGAFFNSFDNKSIEDCEIEVKVSIEKRDSVMVLLFFIDGVLNLACDRCLDIYSQQVFGDYKLIIQLGGELNQDNDNDDDIILLSRKLDFIEISKPIYDYILLSLPIQYVHSKIENCNKEMLNLLNNTKEDNTNKIDPRWEILNKLKNN